MATILDVALFDFFNIIFVFLLIFTVLFALLTKYEFFGKKAGAVNITVAIAVAFISITVAPIVTLINFIAPWFVIFFLFLVLLLLSFSIMGAKEDHFTAMIQKREIVWPILGIAIIIITVGLGSTFGPDLLEAGQGNGDIVEGEFENNVFDVIFHPAVLGMGLLFAISIFAVALLTGDM